jgi:hypothetical protein
MNAATHLEWSTRAPRVAPAWRRRRLLTALMILGTSGAQAAAPDTNLAPDPARVQAIAAMLPEHPRGIGRPIQDRVAWEVLAKQPAFRKVLETATKQLGEPLPQTSDDLYLEFSRTGNRTKWQDVQAKRQIRLDQSVLAECLENKGRFLPMFRETLRSISDEQTWVMPAHDGGLANFKGKATDIDLASSRLAWVLATADWLLGNRLDASTRELIRTQVRQRVLVPFREMVEGRHRRNWWLTGSNNWNAVCLAGVTGSALALIEPREERAYYVAAAEKLSRSFLDGVPADGYCTEGVGYWNYGFGHYMMLAETILRATGGRVDLLHGEHVRRIAMYGLDIEIVPGVYPSFSDCSVGARAGDWLIGHIARRWGLRLPSRLMPRNTQASQSLLQTAMYAFASDMAQTRPAVSDWPGPGERTWFDSSGVLIGRPGTRRDCRLAVAMKGGHNAEEHNHNDVGSYIVVVDGRMVLVDPGAEVYTARTFGSHRYDSKVINSFGHPVPVVAGQLQQPGREHKARVIRTRFTDSADTLVLDLRAAYDVPDLEQLERTFVYSRENGGSVSVSDEVVFKTPQRFETALITFGEWRKLKEGLLQVQDGDAATDVTAQADGGALDVRAEELHEDLTAKRTPTRIGLTLREPVEHARITVTIRPSAQGGRTP